MTWTTMETGIRSKATGMSGCQEISRMDGIRTAMAIGRTIRAGATPGSRAIRGAGCRITAAHGTTGTAWDGAGYRDSAVWAGSQSSRYGMCLLAGGSRPDQFPADILVRPAAIRPWLR